MRRNLALCISLLLLGLAGCATSSNKTVWNKLGANQQDYAKDSYECGRESQTSWSGGGTGLVGLAVMAGVQADAQNRANQMFNRCMEARGWTAQVQGSDGASKGPSSAEIENIKHCFDAIESKPDYQCIVVRTALSLEKSPSLEQLADTSKPSDEEVKAIISMDKDKVICRDQNLQFMKKYVPAKVPILLEYWNSIDLLWADLVERKITWGEFNKALTVLKTNYRNKQLGTK